MVLEDPTSRSIGGGTTSTYTNIFNIDNPAAGKWSLKVPTFVGEYSFVAKVFGDAIIDFAAYFLHQERKDSPVFSIANPLSGKKIIYSVTAGATLLRGGLGARATPGKCYGGLSPL